MMTMMMMMMVVVVMMMMRHLCHGHEVKVVKFLCELCKPLRPVVVLAFVEHGSRFKICPPGVILDIFKAFRSRFRPVSYVNRRSATTSTSRMPSSVRTFSSRGPSR